MLQQLPGHSIHMVPEAVVHAEELRVEPLQLGHVARVLGYLGVLVVPAGFSWSYWVYLEVY